MHENADIFNLRYNPADSQFNANKTHWPDVHYTQNKKRKNSMVRRINVVPHCFEIDMLQFRQFSP